MNIKIYAPFVISVGLVLAPSASHARLVHHSVKKHPITHAKLVHTKSHKAEKHRSNSKTGSLKTVIVKPTHIGHQYRHAALRVNSARKHPIVSISHYPSHNFNIGEIETKAPDGDTRIHSVIETDKTYSFENTDSTAETALHFNSTHGIIQTSFSRDAKKVGLTDDIIQELTSIFAWDIDFASDLNEGDQFTVIYKEGSPLGKKRSSHVIAAEFLTHGKIFTAVRFKDRNGITNYYSPEGRSMKKAFLSAPVDFARISSHFDNHRKHPVLNRIRAHKGVDYAARTGTPVKSSGDGVVTFLGRKGGYGQVITVKHGDRYETLYAHLSNFKKGLVNGDTVKQGEVIGYVGQTGLATGPHLHYEFRIDGVHRNPESLNQGRSVPLEGRLMAEFKYQTQPLLAQLYQAKARNLLAKNM